MRTGPQASNRLGPFRSWPVDLIPDPLDYAAVKAWFERHRDACPTPDGEHIRLFGVSVVNMDRVLQHRTGGIAQDPLSDAVRTSNRLAQAYLDCQLAGVQRCASVTEFNRYELAATPEGFLYRGYKLPPPCSRSMV